MTKKEQIRNRNELYGIILRGVKVVNKLEVMERRQEREKKRLVGECRHRALGDWENFPSTIEYGRWRVKRCLICNAVIKTKVFSDKAWKNKGERESGKNLEIFRNGCSHRTISRWENLPKEKEFGRTKIKFCMRCKKEVGRRERGEKQWNRYLKLKDKGMEKYLEESGFYKRHGDQ